MKKLLLFLVLSSFPLFSQEQLFTNNGPDQVIQIDPRLQQFEYVPGEILVKFKDDAVVQLRKENGQSLMGISSVDRVLLKYNTTSAEKLFPNETRLRQKQILKTYSGKEFERPSLHNIYKLQIEMHDQLFQAIEELKTDENVIYAEPNYIMSVVESEPLSPELTESEMIEWLKENPIVKPSDNLFQPSPQNPNVVTPNDPLYSQQWGIPASQVDAVWDSTTGDTTQIIAVLDTGVDWLHPDLKDNIWINWTEANGIEGIDDDGNGKIDDIRGWDFIDWDNNPLDLNGHGTHVAGIAAAKGNNGLGIAGVNWKAKLLPIKVMDNYGRGNTSNIAQGVYYASSCGANIINMSFGMYSFSTLLYDALQVAFISSELIAAAGNDEQSIYSKVPGINTAFFPAAFQHVLGVQATEEFSNYDPDGPTFSSYAAGYNYELLSFGGGIISTFPGGNYKVYSGTSMAAPLVSGIISIFNHKNHVTREERWASFINKSRPVNAFQNMFSPSENPVFDLRNYELSDTLEGNDFDNQADAGEKIHLWTRIRNTFGNSDSTFIKLQLSDISKPYYDNHITFIKDTAYLSGIGPFREGSNQHNPFELYLKPTIPNEQNLELELLIWDESDPDTFKQRFSIPVYNGTELTGLLNGNIILTPDRLWMINNSTRLTTGSTLKILPGTHLIVNGSFDNRGYIEAIGTGDSLIIIEKNGNLNAQINKHVIYNLNGTNLSGGSFEHCIINNSKSNTGKFINCNFSNIEDIYTQKLINCNIEALTNINEIHIDTIINCRIENSTILNPNTKYIENSVFENNYYNNYAWGPTFDEGNTFKYNIFQGMSNFFLYLYPNWPASWINSKVFELKMNTLSGFTRNAFILRRDMRYMNIFEASGLEDYLNLPDHYFGTTNLYKIKKYIIDFEDNASLPLINLTPMMIPPSDSLHGFVWKVLVNGKDAQDEYVDPVGVGAQRFDVYFNRPMDPSYTPQLSFGGIEPFASYTVSDSASWSPDGKIWTAYHTMKVYTGDGINRIRVSGARDLEGWEIPVEDQRFEFLIDAAGSASTEFMATAGLGKVNLEWRNPELVPDLLGYNMYRFEHLTDTTFTVPVQTNNTLLTDTLFTDFNVIPNKKYYYYYKVVRTDFSESDSSRITNATPFTAAIGDANGDLSVSVLDILSEVSYILGQTPQPFIFDAADVARDSVINVLDVVGTVNIIMGGAGKYFASESFGNAKIELINNKLMLTTDIPLAGIQLKLKGSGMNRIQFINQSISGFENVQSTIGDTVKVIMYYTLNNNELSAGSYELGRLEGISSTVYLTEAVLADKLGNNVLTNVVDNGVPLIPAEYYLDQNFPNPFNSQTTIQYGVPEKASGRITIYNILGQRVKTFELGEMAPGRYSLRWDGRNNYGASIASGVYIYRFETKNYMSAKKLLLLK